MAAPKGHKFSVGNNGGRPVNYESEEELINKCEEYFQYIEDNNEKATLTGLALYLGFASRQSLYDYEKTEKFSYIIKRAKTFVEHEYEKALQGDKPTGPIFALKNMGWRDRQILEHHDADGAALDDKSDEELDEMISKLQAKKNEP